MRYVWPPTFDEHADRRAAFGHLVEGLLQQEQPEVYNAFKVSKRFVELMLILLGVLGLVGTECLERDKKIFPNAGFKY